MGQARRRCNGRDPAYPGQLCYLDADHGEWPCQFETPPIQEQPMRDAEPQRVVEVDGVDYSPDGIMALHAEVAAMRDEAMKQWPEAIPITVVLTHVLAILYWAAEKSAADR